MKVFITGGSGFVGSAVIAELVNAGHQVTGLARSDANAKSLADLGAKAHRGDLEDHESLKSGAKNSDGVIHCGFIHDFARFAEVSEIDRKAIETLGSALEGSDRPLVVTSGTALIAPGRVITENDLPPAEKAFPRKSEAAVQLFADKGVRVSAIRLSPSVHGDHDHGFVPTLINIARQKGVSAYIGEGLNRWTAVHRLDAAVLYRLALESKTALPRLHGVAEEAIRFRDLAEAIGKGLNLPVVSKSPDEADAHFGWFSRFAAIDAPASSKLTQEKLGWKPTHATLAADLASSKTYFAG